MCHRTMLILALATTSDVCQLPDGVRYVLRLILRGNWADVLAAPALSQMPVDGDAASRVLQRAQARVLADEEEFVVLNKPPAVQVAPTVDNMLEWAAARAHPCLRNALSLRLVASLM